MSNSISGNQNSISGSKILFLAGKMCHPQCRDEERCAENHSNDHNFALETIQMPSFWEYIRRDVLHHDKASRDTEASHGRGTERPPRRRAAGRPPGRPAARAACREPKLAAGFFAFRRRCKHSEYNSDVEDTETDQPPKAGHLNRLQCKVMTSSVIRTSVNEGVLR